MTSSLASEDARFRVYPQFEQPPLRQMAHLKHRLQGLPPDLFPGDGLPDRLARSLARHKAINLKELLESFEFFFRVRRRLRRPVMADLCCGHGLTGLLFALCERSVERVLLLDERQPGAHAAVLAATVEVGPWVAGKVEYYTQPLEGLADSGLIPEGAGITMVHGCGSLTDQGLEVGIATGGPMAVMPCCYGRALRGGHPGIQRALGRELATDIARTYRLEGAGYQVDWNAIPRPITPKNRLLVAWQEARADPRAKLPGGRPAADEA